jgi:TM2 domain-containing membrane protein YozV
MHAIHARRATRIGVLLMLLCAGLKVRAMGPFTVDSLSMATAQDPRLTLSATGGEHQVLQENHRAVAIALAALLGPFGAHRLYLGTTPKVAIAYGLTFGGFGVVALIDLVHLIVVKDLDRFRNNDRILMWAAEPTPP